jgi:hypothetical protein
MVNSSSADASGTPAADQALAHGSQNITKSGSFPGCQLVIRLAGPAPPPTLRGERLYTHKAMQRQTSISQA